MVKLRHFHLFCSYKYIFLPFNIHLDLFFFVDALPEGLVRELPNADADESQHPPPVEPAAPSLDDLEDLRRQLEALNS